MSERATAIVVYQCCTWDVYTTSFTALLQHPLGSEGFRGEIGAIQAEAAVAVAELLAPDTDYQLGDGDGYTELVESAQIHETLVIDSTGYVWGLEGQSVDIYTKPEEC
jgi:hypothetical protein